MMKMADLIRQSPLARALSLSSKQFNLVVIHSSLNWQLTQDRKTILDKKKTVVARTGGNRFVYIGRSTRDMCVS